MSVYIKGMKLPTDEPRRLVIYPDGRIYDAAGFFRIDATAEQPPSHGRLGDLDVFESIKYELPNGQRAFNRGFHSGVQYVQRLIMNAPTIIPADPAEEE